MALASLSETPMATFSWFVIRMRRVDCSRVVVSNGGGEVAASSAAREVEEEAGITLEAPLRLFSFYSNNEKFPGDHVALYLAETAHEPDKPPQIEIAEARFFAPDDLPKDVTGGTCRRIDEVLRGTEPAAEW